MVGFAVGASVVVLLLAFNWLIPFLRAPADAGVDANRVLDRLSSAGAIAFPVGVVLMGLGYFGIILCPKRERAQARGTGAKMPSENEPQGDPAHETRSFADLPSTDNESCTT